MYDDLIGKQFEYHGRGPDKYDCLGLVIEVLRRNNIDFPDFQCYDGNVRSIRKLVNSEEQINLSKRSDKPEILSIVTFKLIPHYVTHIGVIIDKFGNFIHVLDGTWVTIENINSITWSSKVEGFYIWET